MRFRNQPVRGGDFAGNKHPAFLGRHVRSRLFVEMDKGRLFRQAPLGDKYPSLRTTGDKGQTIDTPIQPRDDMIAEWESDPIDPIPALPDTRPPENFPMDVREGGKDQVAMTRIQQKSRYVVTGTTSSRALNVSAPTAANCAQVLNALLLDLEKRDTVRKE